MSVYRRSGATSATVVRWRRSGSATTKYFIFLIFSILINKICLQLHRYELTKYYLIFKPFPFQNWIELFCLLVLTICDLNIFYQWPWNLLTLKTWKCSVAAHSKHTSPTLGANVANVPTKQYYYKNRECSLILHYTP